jgi:hypothetical protein
MARWLLLALTVLFITGYAASTERTLAYQQTSSLSLTIPSSLPSLSPNPSTPNEKIVMGIVRHVEPAKGIVILETHTDVFVVRAPTEVCRQLHKGDVIMATLAPDEEKIPV